MSALLALAVLYFSAIVILCTSELEVLNYINIKVITNSATPCSPTAAELCLTLEQFSENATRYSYSNTSLTLEFLPGDHRLTSHAIVNAVSNLTLFSQTTNANIICYNNSGHPLYFEFLDIAIVEVTHLTFLGCGFNNFAALKVISSNLSIKECMFHDLKGIAVDAKSSNITMYKSKFSNSFESNYLGNILHIFNSNFSIAECKFYDSEGTFINAHHSNITIFKNEFINSSHRVLLADNCSVSDIGSLYYNNSFEINPHVIRGSVVRSYYSVLNFSSCKFYTNGPGALFWIDDTTVVLNLSEVANNTVYMHTELFFILDSTVRIKNSCIKENIARYDIFFFSTAPFY